MTVRRQAVVICQGKIAVKRKQLVVLWTVGALSALFFFWYSLWNYVPNELEPLIGGLLPLLILGACAFLHVTFYKRGK